VVISVEEVHRFPTSTAQVLVAPFAAVNRGLNILVADRAAISSIWVSVRQVPLLDQPDELLAHVTAHARAAAPPTEDPLECLRARQRAASAMLETILRSHPAFAALDPQTRIAATADMLVALIQLVGRARRGGTPAELLLVDHPYQVGGTAPGADLPALIHRLADGWAATGQLELLRALYGNALDALLSFADYPTTSRCSSPSPTA
jgi:hypothetical protein